jgi:GH18 family chitinase
MLRPRLDTQQHGQRLVGYLPDYRISNVSAKQLGKHYTDIVLYSVEATKSGGIDSRWLSDSDYRVVKRLKDAGVQRVLICIGGGGRSGRLDAATNDRPSRARLVRELQTLCLERGFDGVDFDWEFPRTAQQRSQFAHLIIETKRAFAAKGLLVTAAMISKQPLSRRALDSLDYLHLMAYDGPGEHASCDFAYDVVENYLARGVPAKKLCMGVPFYGRGVLKRSRALPYRKLAAKRPLDPDTDKVGDLYFNGESTLKRKADYALAEGLGGIMVWEVGQDTNDAHLARTLSTALRSSAAVR